MLSLNKRIQISILVGFIIGATLVSLYSIKAVKQIRRVTAHAQAAVLVDGFNRTQDINSLPKEFAGEKLSYTLYNSKGEVISFSNDLIRPLKLKSHIVTAQSWLPDLTNHGDKIGVPVTLSNGDILMVSKYDRLHKTQIMQVVNDTTKYMLLALIHFSIFYVFIVYAIVRWTLSPIKKAAQAAKQISINNPKLIPTEKQPHEIVPLLNAVNGAVTRLTKAYNSQKQFIADAAHELRTPLTALSLRLKQVEHLKDSEVTKAHFELEQIQNLTEQLLELARLEGITNTSHLNHENINLCRLLRESIANHYPLFEQKNRAIELENSQNDIHVKGFSHLLSLVLKNLLDNALNHGSGRVLVGVTSTKKTVNIYVGDQGESPSKDIQKKLFQRFYKAEVHSSGSGLGLAIVAEIIKIHDGKISFCGTQKTRIKISLPICEA
ncbi:MAG: sensor histidine kinase [Parashewanella sp.]